MKLEKAKQLVKTLDMIAQDAEDDATNFDGLPFEGKTVAEYFGNHGASIAALAGIMKQILEDDLLTKNQ